MRGRPKGKPITTVAKPIKGGQADGNHGGMLPRRRHHLLQIGHKAMPHLTLTVTAAGPTGKAPGIIRGATIKPTNGIGEKCRFRYEASPRTGKVNFFLIDMAN